MRRLAALATALLLRVPAADAENLVPNPDFDAGIDHWSLLGNPSGATISYVADDGSPAPGALRIDRPDQNRGNSTTAVSDCIVVDPSIHYDLMVSVKVLTGAVGYAYLSVFSDAQCGEPIGPAVQVLQWDGADAIWHELEALDFALPDATASLRIAVSVGVPYPETLSAVLFDHVGLGPTGTVPVTLQTFVVD